MSANETTPTIKVDLQEWQIKSLLQDIDVFDALRDAASLRRICNDNPRLYGLKGSHLRRSFQRKFDRVKRCSIEKCIEILDKYEVDPSATTLRIHRTEPAPKDDDEGGQGLAATNDAGEQELGSAFAGLNLDDDEDDDCFQGGLGGDGYQGTEFGETRSHNHTSFSSPAPTAASLLKPSLASSRRHQAADSTSPLLRSCSSPPEVAPTCRHLHCPIVLACRPQHRLRKLRVLM
jgi:hypothetical protein